MISFRLDPQLTSMMDARCQDLNISRAEFLRGLIVGELGSPVVEGTPNSTDVRAELDAMAEQFEVWVTRKISDLEKRLGDRLSRLESSLSQRR